MWQPKCFAWLHVSEEKLCYRFPNSMRYSFNQPGKYDLLFTNSNDKFAYTPWFMILIVFNGFRGREKSSSHLVLAYENVQYSYNSWNKWAITWILHVFDKKIIAESQNDLKYWGNSLFRVFRALKTFAWWICSSKIVSNLF